MTGHEEELRRLVDKSASYPNNDAYAPLHQMARVARLVLDDAAKRSKLMRQLDAVSGGGQVEDAIPLGWE
jgi:hypothetical protein